MTGEEELARIHPERDMAITVGIFDGVHLGHRRLLKRLISLARKEKLIAGVITFRDHPDVLFHPGSVPPYLASLEERVNLLKKEGARKVIVLPFDKELARTDARSFVGLLLKHLRMKALVVGTDFAMGKDRKGNAGTLKSLGKELGFKVTIVPPLVIGGEIVSSTRVKEALGRGDMPKVAELLGRPFSLKRRVIPGVGRGAKLGFPTANLDVEPEQALPEDGVYASFAEFRKKKLPSITYIGKAPTFGNPKRSVEVYIFDFSGTLYGKMLKIDIITKIRPDRKFEKPEVLKNQIREDIRQAKTVLMKPGKH